ncbi:uncharacterized protein SCHCODRAFT_02683537 [Schizophyllum commune H4-8]|uniref:uncharacterized protein n=1 Tax=Schizophyllum commune (strain H4-8 / FGSC 9210) TaxID=578458 RepID=UPI00215F0877|nr:uncharacterized protein SCHCODRAFT_02683537 [Schizophyllum commune H4-8]KAI5900710.1 hypothetical protein SCHCODRAFT_02683537 [Schizophyllum commune H4-8]
MVKQPWHKCPFSGETEHLWRISLIPTPPDDADEAIEKKVALTEWVWGLRRGGLHYYLASSHNTLFFRKDIADLYASFQFLLVPTFNLIKKIDDFAKSTGVLNRDEKDKSRRRPLTALRPPSGVYRYVFIPFTDAARKLQTEFDLQPQTAEDLTGWVHPLFGNSALHGTAAFPVVECHAHPYSICSLAESAFKYRKFGTTITAQYSIAALDVLDLWNVDESQARVPQWFIDLPEMYEDDITVMSSEAKGYTITSQADGQGNRIETIHEDDDLLQARVTEWAGAVDPNSVLEEQPPILRSPLQLRRSPRIQQMSQTCGKSSLLRSNSPVREAPWPLPENADLYRHPPAWTKRTGRFPTREFSSNDWAYFCYNVVLATSRGR